MKRLALIFFFLAAALTVSAIKAEKAAWKKRLAIAAGICWGIVAIGFLV